MKGCSKDGKECGKDSKDAKDSDRQEPISSLLEGKGLFGGRLNVDAKDVLSRKDFENTEISTPKNKM